MSTAPRPDCIFCRIVAGDVPSRQVHADEHAVAFLDLEPWHRGHTLVVPRRHVRGLDPAPIRPISERRRNRA